jgi:hypothetical protein
MADSRSVRRGLQATTPFAGRKRVSMRDILFLVIAAGIGTPALARDTEPEIVFKVLLVIKAESDTYSPLFLPIRSRMTDSEIAQSRRCFEVETADMVNEITAGKVRFAPTVLVSKKPLRIFDPTRLDSAEYYPPELLNELREVAKPGEYDSVGCYFLHYDTASGYRIPRAGFGVGGFDSGHSLGMFAVNCGAQLNPRDEIFLHEWMHGLDGFYGNKPGVKLPKGSLHGAGQHGYTVKPWHPDDTFRGWMEWYKDYLNGNVREGGQLTGLGSVAWHYGPMRLGARKVAGNYRSAKLPVETYPAWVYELMKGDLSHAILGPPLLEQRLEPGKLSESTSWRLEMWDRNAGTEALITPEDAGTLVIYNPRPNDASLVRTISLRPLANYVFVADVRSEGVEITQEGGRYAVTLYAGDSASTKDLAGTQPWTTIALPFSTGAKADSYAVRIALGGFASVARGLAFFRNVQVKKVGYPAKDVKPQQDGETKSPETASAG